MIVHKRVQSRPTPSWFLPHHGHRGTVEGVSISALFLEQAEQTACQLTTARCGRFCNVLGVAPIRTGGPVLRTQNDTRREPIGTGTDRHRTVATQIHTAPEAFGKIMSTVKPRMAVAFHFFNDPDTRYLTYEGIRSTYHGPLTMADDLMVWNVTKDAIRVRTVAPIDDAWPTPSQRPIPPIDTSGMKNVSPEIQGGAFDVIRENRMIYDRVNKKYGTNIEMRVTK